MKGSAPVYDNLPDGLQVSLNDSCGIDIVIPRPIVLAILIVVDGELLRDVRAESLRPKLGISNNPIKRLIKSLFI